MIPDAIVDGHTPVRTHPLARTHGAAAFLLDERVAGERKRWPPFASVKIT